MSTSALWGLMGAIILVLIIGVLSYKAATNPSSIRHPWSEDEIRALVREECAR